MNPTRKNPLLRAALCALAFPAFAPAAQTLYYSFEELTEGELGDEVPIENLAPNAETDGTFFMNFGFGTIVNTPTIRIDGLLYDLGKGLELIPGADSDSGLDAPSIDTGLFLFDLGIQGDLPYTAMAWVNFANGTGDNMIFGSIGGNAVHLGSRGANLHSGHWGDDLGPDQGLNIPSDAGFWHHVTYTNSGADGIQSIYVDGELSATGAPGSNGNPTDDFLLIGTSNNPGSFNGIVDELKVYNTLLTPEEIIAASLEGLTEVQFPSITSIELTARNEVTITLEDFVSGGTTIATDESTLSLTRNGDAVTATITRTGTTTTIVHTFEAPLPRPYTFYEFIVSADTTGGDAFTDMQAIRSYALPETLPGDDPVVGTWQYRQFDAPTPDLITSAIEVAANEDPILETTVPVLNHSIFGQGIEARGIFTPDFEVPENASIDYVIAARTKVTVPDPGGPYTFSIQADDGYALRVTGATISQISGDANNAIDSQDPTTAVFPIGTGNTNARVVYDFPAGGDYLVEFVNFQGGGGAFFEVSWAQGSFANVGDTATWTLVGNPADPSVGPFSSQYGEIPASVIPPIPAAGGWGTSWFYEAENASGQLVNNLAQTVQFFQDLAEDPDFVFFNPDFGYEGPLPYLNHSDIAQEGSGPIAALKERYPGADDSFDDHNNIALIAHGNIEIPEAGTYTLQVRADDGFLFRFVDPNIQFTQVSTLTNGQLYPSALNEMFHPTGTGDTNTRGIIDLPAGTHEVVFIWWEGGGGSYVEVTAAEGVNPGPNDGCWQLIGDSVPAPDDPILTGVGITEPGWTVLSSTPQTEAPGNFMNVELILDDAAGVPENTTIWPSINFTDPQTNGCTAGIDGVMPWPNNTSADDNNYAMRGSATLTIPADGTYVFGFQADDATYIEIDGAVFDFDTLDSAVGAFIEGSDGSIDGTDRVVFDGGTGNNYTVVATPLTAGEHEIRFGFYEIGGGSYVSVWGATGESYDVNENFGLRYRLPLISTTSGGQPFAQPLGLALVGGGAPPTDSGFLISEVTYDGADFSITFASEDAVPYSIEVSTGLGTWVAIPGTVNGTGSSTTVIVTAAQLDAALGAGPRDRVFTRVIQPAG